MAELNQPLIQKHYYENCPGCKVDKAKEATTGIPVRTLLNIWMVVLCTTLPISSLFPFLYFMIRDFHVAEREEDIGTYAGYVGSVFMLGRSLTAVFWGVIADRYGRKPVIFIGVITVVIFNTLFGLSVNYWMALATRFLLGSLNGLLGPMKAYATEIFREEHQSLGLSTVSAAWAIGLIIGPALGGYLSQPVEKYPNIFPKDSFWDKFPYFLPCFCISLFASAAVIACIWLPETLHNHVTQSDDDESEAIENGADVSNLRKGIEGSKGKDSNTKENLLLNWPLMSSILVYCIFSLHDVAYQEVFSLWAVSPRRLGGLSYHTDNVGDVLAISGVALIIYQITIYPSVERACGPLNIARITAALSIPVLQTYPFMAMLSGLTLFILINIASILKSLLSVTITTGLFLIQNRAVEQHQRGAANGISMTAMSVFKAIGPAGGGAVFSWSQKRINASFLPGSHMVFFVLNLVEAVGLVLMFKPFLGEKKKRSTNRP